MKYFILLFFACFLFAGTYNDAYKLQSKNINITTEPDPFMYGDFKKIIRFDMLEFKNNQLLDSKVNKDIYKNILDTLDEYTKNNEDIVVKIIGHTDEPTDDINEKIASSKTYADSIIGLFTYSLDKNTSELRSKDYATYIQNSLISDKIKKEIIVVEYRGGKDMAFSDATTKGRLLSNRVMVTIYVHFADIIDSDKDTVFDGEDKCPGTPEGATVDNFGCPVDSDNDGVFDYEDRCPNTPLYVRVDKDGCPFDSDGDGVLDYKDTCPDTNNDITVDLKGCPRSQDLNINFKSKSYKILPSSYNKIIKFVTFLKANPGYNAEIIGHTDSVGKAGANMMLSQHRANSSMDALIAEGIDSARLTSRGRGELDPIMTNRTKEGRSANRRIEVKLVYKEK